MFVNGTMVTLWRAIVRWVFTGSDEPRGNTSVLIGLIGAVPGELSLSKSLVLVDLSSNSLTGPFELGDLSALKEWYICKG